MNILSIETSCDETAVSIINAREQFPNATYKILGDALRSQKDIHKEYGGVFPTVAKREHAKMLIPLLTKALTEAELLEKEVSELTQKETKILHELFTRDPNMADSIIDFFQTYSKPDVDIIAVTSGPGLEPALWVGVNFAKALSEIWNMNVVPVNHMEGHILASIFNIQTDDKLADITFPAISLLISGGHTELILMTNWNKYKKIGQTLDDAVGEAFDKVARMMGIGYPGGAELSRLAAIGRQENLPSFATLPRPMLHSKNFHFSFSGLKTAVMYAIKDRTLSKIDKHALSRDFEDATLEVLLKKTTNALTEYGAKTLIVGGGVSANTYFRQEFNRCCIEDFPDVTVYFPNPGMSTDNSIMIALSGHAHSQNSSNTAAARFIKADGNKSLDS